jgi:predicted transcriptional regulator
MNDSNKPLYALASEFVGVREKLLNSDFDDETIADTLEALAYPLEKKAENIAAVTKDLDAWKVAIDEAIGELSDRKKRIEKKQESIREYLKNNMESCGITRIESPLFTISIKKCPPSVTIVDEESIPEAFFRMPEVKPAPNKDAIKKALLAGETVAGTVLVQNKRLEIK